MGYAIHQTEPAPPPASEAHNIPAPALLTEAADRAAVKAALDALGAAINDVRQALLDSEHLE